MRQKVKSITTNTKVEIAPNIPKLNIVKIKDINKFRIDKSYNPVIEYWIPHIKHSDKSIRCGRLWLTSYDFYDKNFGSLYESDKENMRNFLKFIGNSIIFAHNAPFDMTFIKDKHIFNTTFKFQ